MYFVNVSGFKIFRFYLFDCLFILKYFSSLTVVLFIPTCDLNIKK